MKAWKETSWGLERVEEVKPGNVPGHKIVTKIFKLPYRIGIWYAKCAEVGGVHYVYNSRIDK